MRRPKTWTYGSEENPESDGNPAEKLGAAFGRLADSDMIRVNRALALFVGIAP